MSADAFAPVGVAVVGAGYWGPNLVRNLGASRSTDLVAVCDLDAQRAAAIAPTGVAVTDDLNRLLDDPRVEAIAVATPPSTHLEVALAALDAGKHVLVEKPLAPTVAEGEKLVDVAAERELVLMCDHTYCYTPAVQKLRHIADDGTLGRLQYFDSVRINLGLIQRDVDVFWDLAPHDLSILDFVLPDGLNPVTVAAQAADPLGTGLACMGYLTLKLDDGAIAHIHVNWLSPVKIRTTIVGGDRRTVVWDDLNPAQRLSIYDKGVEYEGGHDAESRRNALVSYRVGDMVAPALKETEALQGVVADFAGSIRLHRRPATDGASGLRLLRILEAVQRSIGAGGVAVPVQEEA